MFAHPDRIESKAFRVDFFGLSFAGDLSRFLDWEVYFYGAYEIEVLLLFDDILDVIDESQACFIDVGANVGHHSIFVARRGGRVISFEPWAWARDILEERVNSNNLDNVEIMPFALGETECVREFYAPIGNNLGTGSLLAEVNNPNNNEMPISVQLRRDDDVLCELEHF